MRKKLSKMHNIMYWKIYKKFGLPLNLRLILKKDLEWEIRDSKVILSNLSYQMSEEFE